jgi:DNA invertase Pin-like site-specific DNA recombinase
VGLEPTSSRGLLEPTTEQRTVSEICAPCRGIGFRSLRESPDTTTASGRLVFHIFAALVEFVRELVVEGTHEGLAAAKAGGVKLGRPRR